MRANFDEHSFINNKLLNLFPAFIRRYLCDLNFSIQFPYTGMTSMRVDKSLMLLLYYSYRKDHQGNRDINNKQYL